MEMMRDIRSHVKHWDDEDEVRAYLRKMMDGEVFDHKGLIYGMGHAVYSLSDPRSVYSEAMWRSFQLQRREIMR